MAGESVLIDSGVNIKAFFAVIRRCDGVNNFLEGVSFARGVADVAFFRFLFFRGVLGAACSTSSSDMSSSNSSSFSLSVSLSSPLSVSLSLSSLVFSSLFLMNSLLFLLASLLLSSR